MDDWTEKYRPRNLHEIIGNDNVKKSLKQWAERWGKEIPKKKALILSGKPGIGKTTYAYALANQYKWITIELNTSDARNKNRIKKVATSGSINQSFSDNGNYTSTKTGGRKLILLDEADNLYERNISSSSDTSNLSDKGGKKEIIHTIEITKQPIILIVNDYFKLIKGTGKPLEKICFHIRLFQPKPVQIQTILKMICQYEKIKIDPTLIQELSIKSKGDIRSAIRDLQSLCIGKKKVYHKDYSAIGNRDREEDIFHLLNSIYQTVDIPNIKQRLVNNYLDPSILLHWITENLPRVYSSPSDKAKAYHYLSNADLFLSRTLRRNNYRLWAYAFDQMTFGVSLSKTKPIINTRFNYPTWLKKMKLNIYKNDHSLIEQLSDIHHCSIKKTIKNIYPFIIKLIENQSINIENVLKNTQNAFINQNNSYTKAKQNEDEKTNNLNENIKKQKTLFVN
jgi:replication factor C large subunit